VNELECCLKKVVTKTCGVIPYVVNQSILRPVQSFQQFLLCATVQCKFSSPQRQKFVSKQLVGLTGRTIKRRHREAGTQINIYVFSGMEPDIPVLDRSKSVDFLKLFISMESDNTYELRPPAGLLLIPQTSMGSHGGMILTGETEELGENLFRCHFVHHMYCHGREPGHPR